MYLFVSVYYTDEKRQSEHGDQKPRCENGDLFGMILKLLQTECSKTTSPSRQPLMESQQEVKSGVITSRTLL